MRFALRLLTLLAVVTPIVWLTRIYPALPSVIPNHYDSHGVPHRFAGKAILWLLAAVSVGLTIVLQIVSRFPTNFNLPGPMDDPRRPILEALVLDLLAWIGLEVALMFDLLLLSLVQTARQHSSPLDGLIALPILVVAATSAWYIVRMKRLAIQPHTT